MADQGKAARAVYDAIIDQEIDTARLLEEQVGRLDVTKGRLQRLARKIFKLRVAGELTRGEARRMFVEGFVLSLLAEYAHDAPVVKRIVDAGLARQVSAVKALDVPVRALKPIRDFDIKARATAREAESAGVDLHECSEDCEDHPAGVSESRLNQIESAVNFAITGKLRGPGRGRLPSLKNLKDKTPEQLIATLKRFKLDPDVREFERRAKRVYEQQLLGAIEDRGFPDADTWAAIDAQLDRASVSVLRQQTKRAVQEYRVDQLKTAARYFVWIAVGRGSCPSCEKRHGKSKTMRQWEAAGLPGASVLICQQECRCSLQPDFLGKDDGDIIAEVVDEALEGLRQVAAFR